MASPPRRSSRRRAPNRRYAEDASQLLEELDPVSIPEQLERELPKRSAEVSSSEVDENPGSTSEASFDEAPESDAATSDDASEGSVSSDVVVVDQSQGLEKTPTLKRKRPTQVKSKSEDIQRSRGLIPTHAKLHHVKDIVIALGGPDRQDQRRLSETIQHWFNDGIIPSRRDIAQATNGDGLSRDMATRRETGDTDPWAWYSQPSVKEAIQRLQPKHQLAPERGQEYYPPRSPVHKTVLGPYWHQTLHQLKLGEPMHLADAWRPARDTTMENSVEDDSSGELERKGWIINLGAKVQSLSWAPNRDEDTQCLAIALDHPAPALDAQVTAFEPSSKYKSSIQIWRFQAWEEGSTPKTLDPTRPPVLAHIICTEWGRCREIKWCPIPRKKGNEDEQTHLGLMATIWSDGYIRVLDITSHTAIHGGGVHVKYDGAIFASKPPRSVCTTVAWISATTLVAGCADGKIAMWDISQSIQDYIDGTHDQGISGAADLPEEQDHVDPIPYFVYQLHDSYILSAKSCLPHYPFLLITVSTDGYYRLCDLRNPEFDTVESHRYRLYPSNFDYCPHLNAAIAPDAYDTVHLLALRRFFTEQEVTVCDARIQSVACGRAHTCTLLGCVDGSVLALNIIPRIVRDRRNPRRYDCVWFKHEWRPEADTEGNADQNFIRTRLPSGVSRILDGFKPRLKSSKKLTDAKVRKMVEDTGGRTWETIYEEPSAVTQVEWNPVPRCGGWAAAGMGSGLLRVEDLAISP